MKQFYIFEIKHPEYGETKVIAEDRLHAIVEAAHKWGVIKWTYIARDCECARLGPAPEKKRAPKRTEKKAE